ncbi:MAG: RsmD family RNA methyltransferase [Chthoniobacterales bacterium]
MRVVAGSAGGIPLMVPKSITRPTMDKVRGAVFSSLGDAVPGSRVLDLFAGSGGFGIEALSRGAASATFVDNHRSAVDAIRSNLLRTRLSGKVQLADAVTFLRGATSEPGYDLIFADPPYAKHDDDPDFANLLLSVEPIRSLLLEGGTFILETGSWQKLDALESHGWASLRTRTYGDTAVHYLVIDR